MLSYHSYFICVYGLNVTENVGVMCIFYDQFRKENIDLYNSFRCKLLLYIR